MLYDSPNQSENNPSCSCFIDGGWPSFLGLGSIRGVPCGTLHSYEWYPSTAGNHFTLETFPLILHLGVWSFVVLIFRRLGVFLFPSKPNRRYILKNLRIRKRSSRLIEAMGGDDSISDGASAFKYIISGTLAGLVQVAVGEKKKASHLNVCF